jgi:hypothetical protein
MMREGGREEGEVIAALLVSSSWNRSLATKLQKGEGVAFKNSPKTRLHKTLQLQ